MFLSDVGESDDCKTDEQFRLHSGCISIRVYCYSNFEKQLTIQSENSQRLREGRDVGDFAQTDLWSDLA